MKNNKMTNEQKNRKLVLSQYPEAWVFNPKLTVNPNEPKKYMIMIYRDYAKFPTEWTILGSISSSPKNAWESAANYIKEIILYTLES